MIRNRYNYPTPPIRDIKGKETQTRNKWTVMETSLAESQTDSYFPTKWPNGYPKQKDVSDTHIQRRNYKKNKPWQKNRLGTVSEKYFTGVCVCVCVGQCYVSENTKNQQVTEMKQRWGLDRTKQLKCYSKRKPTVRLRKAERVNCDIKTTSSNKYRISSVSKSRICQ